MLSTKNTGALIDNAPLSNSKGEAMLKIKLTRNTVAGGKARRTGDIVSIPESEARFLIAIKKALPVSVESRQVENREQDINTSKRGRKGKK